MHTIKCHNNKPRLLFKSGFYSRAASIQGRLLNETSHYLFIYFDFQVTFIQLTAQLLLLFFVLLAYQRRCGHMPANLFMLVNHTGQACHNL